MARTFLEINEGRYGCTNSTLNSDVNNTYFMAYLESLVGSKAHFSKQTDYMMTLMSTFTKSIGLGCLKI